MKNKDNRKMLQTAAQVSRTTSVFAEVAGSDKQPLSCSWGLDYYCRFVLQLFFVAVN